MAFFKRIDKNSTNEVILSCDCGDKNHLVQFSWFEENEKYHPEMYIEVRLQEYPFFRRLWVAFLYIIGRSGGYSGFGETVFNYEEAEELHRYLEEYLDKNKDKRRL